MREMNRVKRAIRAWFFFAVLVLLGTGAQAQQPSGSVQAVASQGEGDQWLTASTAWSLVQVCFKFEPRPIQLNQVFNVEVQLKNDQGQPLDDRSVQLGVDARMPQHRHGMNVKPEIIALGKGRFRIEGMLFHMPGHWEIYFDVNREGISERALFSFTL